MDVEYRNEASPEIRIESEGHCRYVAMDVRGTVFRERLGLHVFKQRTTQTEIELEQVMRRLINKVRLQTGLALKFDRNSVKTALGAVGDKDGN